MYKKDYCTCFPDVFKGIDISECCKKHDNEVGKKGTFNPITPHIHFFKCLRSKGIALGWSIIITFGGAFFSLIKYPYFVYTKIRYKLKDKK